MSANQKQQHSIQALKDKLSQASRVTIICHINPDGDAIGSALGMGISLENIGKQVCIISPNMVPQYLKWLPTAKRIVIAEHQKEIAKKALSDTDIILCMDFNEPKRIGFLADDLVATSCDKVLIDHHPHPASIFDLTFSDISKSSTAELTYQLLEEMSMLAGIDVHVATCLFTGILTDTGCYCHSSSNPDTYLVTANLLAKGINKDKIKQLVFSNHSEKRMRLLGKVLYQNMQVLPDVHTAYAYITLQDKEEFGFENGDSEGFVNYPLDMKGVVFSVFFTEHEDRIKISFRSKGSFPTNDMAKKYFDGGGHSNASGGESLLNLEETINKFVALIPEYEKELKNTYLKNNEVTA